MGFFDALFGRTRVSQGKTDQLFQLSTAAADIETRLDSRFAGAAAVIVRTVDNSAFEQVGRDLEQILHLGGKDLRIVPRITDDQYGFRWFVLQAPLEDVITGLHMTADLLKEAGFGDGLIAAAFPFDSGAGRWYLIYSYRRATFYPFAPLPGHRRDEAREFRLGATLKLSLNVEKDPERWYALWDPPL
ncbi:conserved protein of unknown function [Candidatus Hydrogenisulfobacillus filiaventi]|uniref:Uncharacterized protein n=1 Tax=Candidatus Hydrogenisulfobacillus filiaventi TaxID=2707344 RepID=A0A6F8ZJI6_9FIRM|nr:hypothetical protein [Bacillota bacterium]CAB1130149.1 conserved protein of unknown function [Candidatus Hydrogenisulfobacillus filiaventi]